MRTHIQKWGNSLGLRISLQLSKRLNLQAGSLVNIDIEDDRIVIQKAKYDLESMLDQMTPENSHSLLLDDSPIGDEEW
jgi:antitoxin MazE